MHKTPLICEFGHFGTNWLIGNLVQNRPENYEVMGKIYFSLFFQFKHTKKLQEVLNFEKHYFDPAGPIGPLWPNIFQK